MKNLISFVVYLAIITAVLFIVTCTKWTDTVPLGYQEPSPDTLTDTQLPVHVSIAPASEPAIAGCTELVNNTGEYTMSARMSGPINTVGVDSIYVTARHPSNSKRQVFYNGEFQSLQGLLFDVYGFTANVVHNDVDIDNTYDFFVILKSPTNQYTNNTWDRPALMFEYYTNGAIFKRQFADFVEHTIWPTPSMNFSEIYSVVSNYPHDRLTLVQSTLTQNEVFGVIKYYQDNCITGESFNAIGMGLDSTIYHIMKDSLQWDVVRI